MNLEPLPKVNLPLVHELFEEQAALHSDQVALSQGALKLTYLQLSRRSEFLAGRIRGVGVGSGDRVGVFLERSCDLIATFLGILKTGAAYVPLDPSYPAGRLGLMARDAGLRTIVTSSRLAVILPSELEGLILSDDPAAAQAEPLPGLLPQTDSAAAAYVMYTSGSTGKPKGVEVPHRGIVRLVKDPDFMRITPQDVFLLLSPISFDASTLEIWGALCNGARLVLMPPGQPSLREIGEVIRREGVTILWLTAGLFNLMVDERLEDLAPVRQLLVGGDVLSVPHVQKALAGLPHTTLINGYGPTENTTFTCCYTIPRDHPAGRSIPIGRPIRGSTVHVVDENLRPVPDGAEGELVTGGLGLALGYWNRPELTWERFVPDPFSNVPGAILYRTGDQVRRLADGNLEFLGRRDTQIKLRGFRIELGEIENALRGHPGVRDCVVGLWADAAGNRSLTAWVVPTAGCDRVQFAELRQHVAERLPEHMHPVFWTHLEVLPLTPNGKVDRARLPAPAKAEPLETPRNKLEQLIAERLGELLGGRAVGVTDRFFDLGASSLMLAQLHERLTQNHGLNFILTDLFQFPSVRALAAHLQSGQAWPTPSADASSPAPRARLREEALSRFKRPSAS